jgi:hypothetical protein
MNLAIGFAVPFQKEGAQACHASENGENPKPARKPNLADDEDKYGDNGREGQ